MGDGAIAPQGTLGSIWRYFWSSQLGWGCCWQLVDRGQDAAKILQCSGQPHTTQNHLVQNDSGTKVEKPWLNVASKNVAAFTSLTFAESQVPTQKAGNNVYVSFLHYSEFWENIKKESPHNAFACTSRMTLK